MQKSLMIIGGSGFVGGNMTKIAQKLGWKVYIADSFYRSGIDDAQWREVNITDETSIKSVILQTRPDAVVNVAAIADIDKAEQDKDLAWKVNVDGARFAAEACKETGAKYIFFSSDAVFDGKGMDYVEEDIPAPINYYGHTKAEAEKEVLKAYSKAVVIRISLVMGFPVTGGNSFFAGLESKLVEGKEVICPTEEIRTPIDVITLSECVLELAENDFAGVVHIGATDSMDRYTLTKKLAEILGYDPNLVKPQDKVQTDNSRAPRHKNGIISVNKAQKVLKTKLLTTQKGIERAFEYRPKK